VLGSLCRDIAKRWIRGGAVLADSADYERDGGRPHLHESRPPVAGRLRSVKGQPHAVTDPVRASARSNDRTRDCARRRDYLPAVFIDELWARVESASRSHGGPAEEGNHLQGRRSLVTPLPAVATASPAAKDELTLQPSEFRLLEYLMKHEGQVGTRNHATGNDIGISLVSRRQRQRRAPSRGCAPKIDKGLEGHCATRSADPDT